jgi:hypothetical protein
MEIKIIQTKEFSRDLKSFLRRKSLLEEDFESLKQTLRQNQTVGDLLVGTGGVRKIRLKSSARGKSGGFRVCFYYYAKDGKVFLLLIYSKNEQDNFSEADRKNLKEFTNEIKNT